MATLPAILLLVFMNVFIALSSAGIVLIQLLANGYNKYISLGVSILVVFGVHIYIMYSHKLRDYITKQGATDEQ